MNIYQNLDTKTPCPGPHFGSFPTGTTFRMWEIPTSHKTIASTPLKDVHVASSPMTV